jgi:hypothetical protein
MPSQTNPHLLGHSATSAARLPEHPAKPELRFAAALGPLCNPGCGDNG